MEEETQALVLNQDEKQHAQLLAENIGTHNYEKQIAMLTEIRFLVKQTVQASMYNLRRELEYLETVNQRL